VNDAADAEGEEPEQQVDPEMHGCAHFERDGDWWDEYREKDHDEGVVFDVGHCLGLRLGLKLALAW